MKKICLIVPDLNKGGMERVMSELANYFASKADVNVNLILLTSKSDIFYKIKQDIIVFKPKFFFNNKYRTISTLKTLFFLRNTIKKIRPDAVLSFGETYNSFVLLSCIFLNVRIFVSDRSSPDKSWGRFHENIRRLLYPRATGIVSQTNYSKDFLYSETGHKNIEVIPNPIREISTLRAERKNIILNVGRLIRSKRIDLLLRIFSKSEIDDWELWLVGENEGNEKDRLQDMAKDLGVADKVAFWGKQENIDRFYTSASIFAFTSESEGLPNVLMEAMASDLACISFNCIAGPADLITDNETGYLVEMYDCDSYIQKLNFLIRDSVLRTKFADNAKKKAKEFDINIIGEKYYNFLLS